MADPYRYHIRQLDSPGEYHFTVTPSDTVDLDPRPRKLYVSAAGNVVVRDKAGTNVTYAVTAGQVLDFSPTRVLATGTTATVVAWY